MWNITTKNVLKKEELKLKMKIKNENFHFFMHLATAGKFLSQKHQSFLLMKM